MISQWAMARECSASNYQSIMQPRSHRRFLSTSATSSGATQRSALTSPIWESFQRAPLWRSVHSLRRIASTPARWASKFVGNSIKSSKLSRGGKQSLARSGRRRNWSWSIMCVITWCFAFLARGIFIAAITHLILRWLTFLFTSPPFIKSVSCVWASDKNCWAIAWAKLWKVLARTPRRGSTSTSSSRRTSTMTASVIMKLRDTPRIKRWV